MEITGLGAARDRRRVRVRIRRPSPVSPLVARFTSLLGLALALGSGTAAAQPRRPFPPVRHAQEAAPPWSGAGGFPPPRSLARAEEVLDSDRIPRPHPAIHGKAGTRVDRSPARLFPRTKRSGAEIPDTVRTERERAMAAHPAGKSKGRHHVVRDGESLWSIAAHVLRTEDAGAIARYWPRVHRANRAVIGADPNTIYTGQVLELPEPN